MSQKQLERYAPWGLLVLTIAIWQLVCSAFSVSEFIFPSPLRIWQQMVEFRDVIAAHAWRTFWVTMAGFGIAIVVGVLLGLVFSVIVVGMVYGLLFVSQPIEQSPNDAAFIDLMSTIVVFLTGTLSGLVASNGIKSKRNEFLNEDD